MTGISRSSFRQYVLCGCALFLAASAAGREPDARVDTLKTPGVVYPEVGQKHPTRVMFQSLLLPGWGQVENAAYFKAALFLGAYGTLVWNGVQRNQDKQDAAGRLRRASEEDRPALQREVDRLSDARNSKFWFAGLTAVIAMADAFVDAHLKKFDDRMDSDIALSGEGIRVGIRWSFSGGSGR